MHTLTHVTKRYLLCVRTSHKWLARVLVKGTVWIEVTSHSFLFTHNSLPQLQSPHLALIIINIYLCLWLWLLSLLRNLSQFFIGQNANKKYFEVKLLHMTIKSSPVSIINMVYLFLTVERVSRYNNLMFKTCSRERLSTWNVKTPRVSNLPHLILLIWRHWPRKDDPTGRERMKSPERLTVIISKF